MTHGRYLSASVLNQGNIWIVGGKTNNPDVVAKTEVLRGRRPGRPGRWRPGRPLPPFYRSAGIESQCMVR